MVCSVIKQALACHPRIAGVIGKYKVSDVSKKNKR